MSRLIAFGSSPILYAPSPDQLEYKGLTFPWLIANEFGHEFCNEGKRFNSNSKIARSVLSYEYQNNDVVIVSWTSTMRFEFRTEHGWAGTNRDTLTPGTFEEHWYQGPGNWEYTSISTTLKEIILAQSFLIQKQIPYLFVFDNNEFLQSWLISNPDEYLTSMIGLINWDRVIKFPDNAGFSTWARSNSFDFHGQREGHPGYASYSAHRAAADYILTNYKLQ